ncbi:MAG TPA: Do family serine endopeptidase [Steroidobacteraceae bacterium]|nr:Do family serine endopeptidase [Steroidobacteraceae bacterium]
MNPKNPALIVSVGAAVAVAAIVGLSAAGAAGTAAFAPVAIAAPTKAEPIPFIGAPNYRAIVAANRAAVVGITSESKGQPAADDNEQDDQDQGGNEQPRGRGNPFGDIPFFRFFPGPNPQLPEQGPQRSLGSGFIVSPNGVILTNAHVVDGASTVTVTLADHREYQAKVLGKDKATDVAVIKIDAKDLPTVHMTSSSTVQVGDYVLAIGAPYGLEETATAGIVSAKGRSLPNDQSVPFIQTDVAVNPGNSGGPLFDGYGNVVGINSQIYSNTGGFQGVAFAIPIEVATHIQDEIVKTGKVEHARLGVSIQTIDQSLARSFHLDTPAGALVSKVEPDSAAARAGLKAGDVILEYNKANMIDAGQLSAAVAMAEPGDAADLKIWRDGRTLDLTAKLGAVPGKGELVQTAASTGGGRLGLAVRPLTSDESSQSGIASGLLVERAQGAAARAGIQPGDVVLAVDGTAVSNVNQLRSMIEKHDSTVALLIQRGDARIFVPVQLG